MNGVGPQPQAPQAQVDIAGAGDHIGSVLDLKEEEIISVVSIPKPDQLTNGDGKRTENSVIEETRSPAESLSSTTTDSDVLSESLSLQEPQSE